MQIFPLNAISIYLEYIYWRSNDLVENCHADIVKLLWLFVSLSTFVHCNLIKHQWRLAEEKLPSSTF